MPISGVDKIKDWDFLEVKPGKYRWVKKGSQQESKRSANSVITDTMNAMVHPITGKLMDSKSEFRKVTKAHNCEEVGTSVQRDNRKLDLPPIKEDIARAIRELEG